MRVAVLEDDPIRLKQIVKILKFQCAIDDEVIECIEYSSGDTLRRTLRYETFDLLVLKREMADIESTEIVYWLRSHRQDQTPILMLSDRDSERDAELALDLGVDDYVGIPIKPFEFAARARRLLIRQKNSSAATLEKFGDWTFDRNMSQAIHEAADGVQHASTLTDREFRLAIALFRNAGRPISRNHLLEGAGYAPVGKARLLDNLIYRLRNKLILDATRGVHLQTVYGQGYRLQLLPRSTPTSASHQAAYGPSLSSTS